MKIEAQTLDLKQAAAYSGLSYWTLRDLAEAGLLARVLIPDPRKPGRNIRRILFRKETIDQFLRDHESAAAIQSAPRKLRKL